MINFIKSAWRGQEKVWKVFWIWGWLIPIIAQLIIKFVTGILPAALGGMILMIYGIICIPYLIWWFVALWRCAFNVETKFFGYLARAYVLMVPLLVIVGLVVGGVLAGQDLIKAAECRKVIMPRAAAMNMNYHQYIGTPQGLADASKCLKDDVGAVSNEPSGVVPNQDSGAKQP